VNKPRPDLWTLKQEARLTELVDQFPKLSCAAIGKLMGKTKNAIIGKITRMREKGAFGHVAITKKMLIDSKWERADDVFLRNYILKGYKTCNIARIMRRTKHEVETRIKKLIG